MLQLIRNIRSAGRTWVLALTALTVVSCAKDLGSPEIVERAGLTISLTVPQSVEREMRNPRTYAGTEPGYGMENTIDSLHIAFYSRSKDAGGAWAKWNIVATKTLKEKELPSFTGTTGGNPTATFTVEGIPVTPSALDGGTELRAVIYANYNQNPGAITAESDLWKGSTLNPLFFTGTSVFGKKNDTWTANVNLTRQVAKLRIKAGIHPDAVPSTLEIDPRSISVTVEKMASASPTTDDGNDPDHKDYDPGDTFAGMEQTIVRSTTSGTPLRMEENWVSGMKIDSLYMHPHDAGTNRDSATVVKVSMKVSDSVSAESKTLTLEYPLGKQLTNGDKDYTIKRNTIYTLDVQVQSIEGDESLNANLEIHDWDDAVIDIDAPWGGAVTSHSALYVLPGEGSTVMTVAAGGGTEPFSVTLMKPDRSGTLDASLASLYRDGSFAAGNTFLLEPSSKAEVQFTATEQFAGAWLKIVKTKGGQPAGLARYIPVGKAEFSAANGSATYAGGDFASQIVCRAAMPDGTTEPLEWTAETVDAGGASAPVPDWLTIQTSGTGNLSGSVAAQENSHRMQTEAAVVNYDLSTRDGLMNTANCYLVHAPGTYSLPLVYGNAIKDGATNAAAYTSTASGTNILNPFFNHSGRITNPYISDNGITLTDAKLLWQDVNGMIEESSVQLSGNRLAFRVTDKIDYGNAVLAVFAGNTIAWSWHIWATDYDPYAADATKTVQNRTSPNTQFDFMTQSLGWCPEKEYAAREARVKVTQSETGVTRIITVQQDYALISANSTCYQWGRKDPFPGSNGNVNKPTYGPNAWSSITGAPRQISTTSIQMYIKNPSGFCTTYGMDGQYYNLWSANSNVTGINTNPVVKTVYDPSPAGFCLPPSGAFTGFTTTGNVTSTVTDFNVSGAWDNGWHFYCNTDGTGETIYFPVSSPRYYTMGTPFAVGSYYCWSAVSGTTNAVGCSMYCNQTRVDTQGTAFHRSYGFSVSPVKEQ